MKKGVIIFTLVFAIFSIYILPLLSADDFYYTNGTFIYLNQTQQFFRGINYMTRLASQDTAYYINPQESDFELIKNYSFNSVRFPLAYYKFIPDNQINNSEMAILNNSVNWSKQNNLSIILDLHYYISSGFNFFELLTNSSGEWTNMSNFWKNISRNFANETTVLGYDLINEPFFYKPFQSTGNKTLITELWRDWINQTYENDFDKWNKSWNGISNTRTFDNETNYNLTSGLLLYWQLDNNSTVGEASNYVYDWTGNGNNASISASPNTDGKLKGAYDFDYLDVAQTTLWHNNYSFDSNQFALAFWMKCANFTQSAGPILFSGWRDSTTIAMYVYLAPANTHFSKIYTFFRNYSGTDEGTLNQIKSSIVCNDTNWKHIVFQYNGSQEQVYINGRLDVAYNITSTVSNMSQFRLGHNGASNYFNGSLDEVMMFNRSLNYSEIWSMSQNHYKAGESENFSTAKIPSIFSGYDELERKHTTSNILINSTFEHWVNGVPTGWINSTTINKSTEATQGDYSLLINATSAFSPIYQIFHLGNFSSNYFVIPEENWTNDLLITFDAKIISSFDDCYSKISCYDSSAYAESIAKNFAFTNTSWNSYSYEWEIDPRFDYCFLEFSSSGNCKALIDNVFVSIEPHSNRLSDFYKFLTSRYKTLVEYLISSIREYDTNHIIFFDSLGHSDGFHMSVLPFDFNLPNDTVSNKLAYATHHYYNPSNSINGWGNIMKSYYSLNLPWINGETGYNKGYWATNMIFQTVQTGGSGFFHWLHVSNISGIGTSDVTTSDSYYCNNISSINCPDIVSGVDYTNLTSTPKGELFLNDINPVLTSPRELNPSVLLVYSDGSYSARDPTIYYNPIKDQLERFSKEYTITSADNLIYNLSFPKTNYLNLSYYNYSIPDQTNINWSNYDKIIVLQDYYAGSARTGYLLEDMAKAGKKVAFIGAPFVIKYPYYDFRYDGYLGNGAGKENTNYSFTYWFNSTAIPNISSSNVFNFSAQSNFYEVNSGQRYSFNSESGYLMNVSLPEDASWIFQDCMWNTSNQLYLCGMPEFAGTSYERAIAGDSFDIITSIIQWLYDDTTLTSSASSYNLTYIYSNDSANRTYHLLSAYAGNMTDYNFTFSRTTLWNFVNKTVECSNCNSLILNFTSFEPLIFYEISNVSLIEGNLLDVTDNQNNLIEDDLEVWVTPSSTTSTKYIASNLTNPLDITAVLDVANCSISSVTYLSHNSNYAAVYTPTQWTCSGNKLTLNISGIETASGSNRIDITYSSSDVSVSSSGRSFRNDSLSKGDSYSLEISPFERFYFSYKNTSYIFIITSVNNNTINFEIRPTEIKDSLTINNSLEFDLDSDEKNDISIFLENITSRKSSLKFTLLEDEKLIVPEQEITTEISSPSCLRFYLIWGGIFVLIIIILTCLVKIIKKKN